MRNQVGACVFSYAWYNVAFQLNTKNNCIEHAEVSVYGQFFLRPSDQQ